MFHGSPLLSRLSVRYGNHQVLTPTTSRLKTIKFPSLVRHYQDSVQFKPARPPNPADLPKPRARKIKPPFRQRKWFRRALILSGVLGTAYIIDTQLNASAFMRSVRTFRTAMLVGLDYKINFREHPPLADSIEALHHRNAERVFDLLRWNGGLYLKIGQAIAMQSAILPPEFQKMFAQMFDDAPQNDWKEVEQVVREDFGKSVEEVFGVSFNGEPGKGVMEKTARASASVAQVHWARLKDGREVAIKIQKKEIQKQIGWDLWTFRVVTWWYTYWFKIPMYTLVPYISERLALETDFENEADNAEQMAELVAGEKRLRGRVYIPKVYRDLSSKRVMTAEWIEGVRLWDKDGIQDSWHGGWRTGSPGAGGNPLPAIPNASADPRIPEDAPKNYLLKPDRSSWRGRDGKGGLGLSLKSVMTTMVDLFSAQMFLWGIVHCDPHPGNIFVRRLPSGKPELVLIDHGLYIHMNPNFRHQYALFWKSLLAFDNKTLAEITKSWGINNPDIFASATLMRPYTGGDKSTLEEIRRGSGEGSRERQERAYRMQVKARDGIKQILGDETKWPKELIFIGRNLRIVQGNNQFLGSPVNRIKITGLWASRALTENKDLGFGERWKNWILHLRFRCVLVLSDVVFFWTRMKQFIGVGKGMEDEIEERMRVMAKDFGVELNHGVFEG
ncbi:ABC1-domain-containing protein [Delitschia confertaspora ATCC 74209]|uniref:ABC1-domain-containing protein n=1 Tax=Delitschia confertaspora ATCC 74209 TaxID=1513339 RepID=A0A9P4JLM4_9PLEO|nr:ABC1-domain-containing protein [Delitschia confertaspora ATCC 74209]